jgi:hypothetical protein
MVELGRDPKCLDDYLLNIFNTQHPGGIASAAIQVGSAVADATATMSYRMGAGTLTISISAFCREDMRDKRAMVAGEKASKLPALMVIPPGLFIPPVLISVILHPVIIKMVDAVRSFSGG